MPLEEYMEWRSQQLSHKEPEPTGPSLSSDIIDFSQLGEVAKQPNFDGDAVWKHGMQELSEAMGPLLDVAQRVAQSYDSRVLLTHLVNAQVSFAALAGADPNALTTQWSISLRDGVTRIINGLESHDGGLFSLGYEEVRSVIAELYPDG